MPKVVRNIVFQWKDITEFKGTLEDTIGDTYNIEFEYPLGKWLLDMKKTLMEIEERHPHLTLLDGMNLRVILTDADRNEVKLPLHLEIEATSSLIDGEP